MARGLHAENANRLQVGAVIPCRANAPGLQVLLDVRGGEPDAAAEHGATLQIVRRDVGQPLLELGAGDRGGAASGREPGPQADHDNH